MKKIATPIRWPFLMSSCFVVAKALMLNSSLFKADVIVGLRVRPLEMSVGHSLKVKKELSGTLAFTWQGILTSLEFGTTLTFLFALTKIGCFVTVSE